VATVEDDEPAVGQPILDPRPAVDGGHRVVAAQDLEDGHLHRRKRGGEVGVKVGVEAGQRRRGRHAELPGDEPLHQGGIRIGGRREAGPDVLVPGGEPVGELRPHQGRFEAVGVGAERKVGAAGGPHAVRRHQRHPAQPARSGGRDEEGDLGAEGMADQDRTRKIEPVENGQDIEGQTVDAVAAGRSIGSARPSQVDADHAVAAHGEGGGGARPAFVVEAEPRQEDDRRPCPRRRPGSGGPGLRLRVDHVEADAGLDLDGRRPRPRPAQG
jgi:hypothetical protein